VKSNWGNLIPKRRKSFGCDKKGHESRKNDHPTPSQMRGGEGRAGKLDLFMKKVEGESG